MFFCFITFSKETVHPTVKPSPVFGPGSETGTGKAKNSRATMDRSHKPQRHWAPKQHSWAQSRTWVLPELHPTKQVLHNIAFSDQGLTTLYVLFLQLPVEKNSDQWSLVCKFYFQRQHELNIFLLLLKKKSPRGFIQLIPRVTFSWGYDSIFWMHPYLLVYQQILHHSNMKTFWK